MPSEMVGSAYARISLDKSDFDSGLDSAHGKFNSVLGSMEGKAASVGKTIGSALIVGTVAAGAALAGVATVGVKSYMDIESAAADAASKMDLSAIAQKSGKTIEESFKGVKEHVIAVSRELGQLNTNAFDPTQIADALANLAAGGFDVASASAKNLTPILSLATATNYGLKESASMAMATMNQYGLSIGDLGEISDVFTQACGDSALGMEDLQYALSYAGPVAKAAGVSLNETVAALEVFSQSGIKGEKAGTALVDVMNTLVSPTGAASKALAGIGVNLKDVDPRTHKFADVLKTLRQRADASGDGLKAFNEIFGVRGGLIYGLAGATKELETFETKLDSSGGAAERMAKLMLNTLGGSFDAAKGAAIDLAVGIGEKLAPTLKKVFEWFSASGAPAIRAFIDAIASGDWAGAGDMIYKGIQAGWQKVKELGGQLLGWLKEVDWSGVGSFIVAGIKGAWAELQNLGSQLLGWLKGVDWAGVGSAIVARIEESWNQLKALGSKLLGWLKAVDWASVGKKAADAFQTAWDALKGLGKKVAGWIETQGGWNALGVKTATAITDAWTAFKGWSTPITSNLKEGFENWAGGSEPIAWGQKLGKALVDGIKYIFGGLGGAAGGGGSLLSDIIDWHMAGYEAGAKFALGFASALAVGIAEALNSVNTEIKIPSWLNPAGKEETINIGMGTKQLEDIKKYWSDKGGTSSPYSPPSYSSGTGGYGTSAPTIEGARGTTGSLISLGSGMSTKITTGFATGGVREEVGIKEWVKQQAEKGVEWTDLKAELNKLGDGRALAKSDLSFLQTVYDDAIKTQTSTADTQIKAAEKAADITVEAAEEAKDTTEDAAKDSADTTTKAAEESAETSKKTTEWAASKWTGLADVMSYAAQTASSSISTTATSAANTLTAAAQNSLTIGNAIASKMQGAGDAVKIGLDAAGRQIAVIGQVAQSQFAAAGGQFVGSANQAGTITTGAATRASGLIQGVTSGFSQAGSTVSNGLNAGANALQGAAGAVTSAANAMRSGSDWVRNLGTTYQTTGTSKGKTTGNYPTWMTDAVPWLADGKETSGPELAVIGEDGKEFVIPTKTKRWDLLLAAMRAYGIRGMADGGAAGTGGASSGEADQMQAYFGITGLASMSKSVQKIINDLKDFFRISWAIIKAEGSTYWKAINAIITAEATTTRNNAWQAALDIRNTWLSSNQQIVADATTTYAAMWPAIEPGVKSIHDGIIYSFQDSGSQVKSLMDQMGSDAMISLTSFQTSWNTVWQQMLADLQSTASQITGILTDLGAKVGSITVNASVNVAGGGAGSYGGSANMTGSGSGGGSGGSDGAIINTNGTANFTDTTCTGDLVLVNALKYTNPNGQTSYINPLTYLETGGISNYQSSGYGGSGGISPSSSGSGYSGGMATAYGSGFSWGAKGALIDTPQRVIVGEKGPELILPAKLTRMFLNLAEGGNSGPGEARPIVIEDHTSHHWYLDGREVTNQIMERATKQLRLKGAISTR